MHALIPQDWVSHAVKAAQAGVEQKGPATTTCFTSDSELEAFINLRAKYTVHIPRTMLSGEGKLSKKVFGTELMTLETLLPTVAAIESTCTSWADQWAWFLEHANQVEIDAVMERKIQEKR